MTISSNGLTVASGGIDLMWDGVGEAWTIISRHIEKYRFSVHKAVKRYLEETTKEKNLHRVQAHVLRGDETAMRWIVRLGFHPEGLCKKYGPGGEDYILYARLS